VWQWVDLIRHILDENWINDSKVIQLLLPLQGTTISVQSLGPAGPSRPSVTLYSIQLLLLQSQNQAACSSTRKSHPWTLTTAPQRILAVTV
jgi:hypothetical protein